MYIGPTAAAHLHAVWEPLRLVWKAQAFRRPQSARVLLSPTQFVVRCDTGPLVRPIQQMFSFGDKPLLDEGWKEVREQIRREPVSRIFNDRPPLRGWRKYFGCPTGPTLGSPMYRQVLARRFAIGYRVDQGMWCQTFENGWPLSDTRLLKDPSPVGLFVAAELDAQWFTGLPFGTRNVEVLAATPYVTVQWHEADDLLPDGPLSIDYIKDAIKG